MSCSLLPQVFQLVRNPLIPTKRQRIRKSYELRTGLEQLQRVYGVARRVGNAICNTGEPQDDIEDGVRVEEHSFLQAGAACS